MPSRLLFGIALTFVLSPWAALAQDIALKLPFGFTTPEMVATDGTNLYVTDFGTGTIEKVVAATGEISVFAGTFGNNIEVDGVGARAGFNKPFGIACDGANLYVSDFGGNTIRKVVLASGQVTTIAGSGNNEETDGTGSLAGFAGPEGLVTDGTNLYVADYQGNTVRKVVIATGEVTTIAGSGTRAESDGTGTTATLSGPAGLVADSTDLYVADDAGNTVRKLELASGKVTTIAGSGKRGGQDGVGAEATFNEPKSLALSGSTLYVAELSGNRIRSVDLASGSVKTVAGSGKPQELDGVGTAAGLNGPENMVELGPYLYVIDNRSRLIRRVTPVDWKVATLATYYDFVLKADEAGKAATFQRFFRASYQVNVFSSVDDAGKFILGAKKVFEKNIGGKSNQAGNYARLSGPSLAGPADRVVVVQFVGAADGTKAIDLNKDPGQLRQNLLSAISVSSFVYVFAGDRQICLTDDYLATGWKYNRTTNPDHLQYGGNTYKADYPIGWGLNEFLRYLKKEIN